MTTSPTPPAAQGGGGELRKAHVIRMTTSRDGPTKHEYFSAVRNSTGADMELYMFHDPMKALYTAASFAKFAGIPCDDLVIDGVKLSLDKISLMMLEGIKSPAPTGKDTAREALLDQRPHFGGSYGPEPSLRHMVWFYYRKHGMNHPQALADSYIAALSTTPPKTAAGVGEGLDEADEAYEIGKLDGFARAVQDIDLATGGDGEYFVSTLPGQGCPDAATMKARIIERFAAPHAPTAGAGGGLTAEITLQEVCREMGESGNEPITRTLAACNRILARRSSTDGGGGADLFEALVALAHMQRAAAENGMGLKIADDVLTKLGFELAAHRARSETPGLVEGAES